LFRSQVRPKSLSWSHLHPAVFWALTAHRPSRVKVCYVVARLTVRPFTRRGCTVIFLSPGCITLRAIKKLSHYLILRSKNKSVPIASANIPIQYPPTIRYSIRPSPHFPSGPPSPRSSPYRPLYDHPGG